MAAGARAAAASPLRGLLVAATVLLAAAGYAAAIGDSPVPIYGSPTPSPYPSPSPSPTPSPSPLPGPTDLSIDAMPFMGASGAGTASLGLDYVWRTDNDFKKLLKDAGDNNELYLLGRPDCKPDKCGALDNAWSPAVNGSSVQEVQVLTKEPVQLASIGLLLVNAPGGLLKVELLPYPAFSTKKLNASTEPRKVLFDASIDNQTFACPSTAEFNVSSLDLLAIPLPLDGNWTSLPAGVEVWGGVAITARKNAIHGRTLHMDTVVFTGRVVYPALSKPYDKYDPEGPGNGDGNGGGQDNNAQDKKNLHRRFRQ